MVQLLIDTVFVWLSVLSAIYSTDIIHANSDCLLFFAAPTIRFITGLTELELGSFQFIDYTGQKMFKTQAIHAAK